MSSTTRRAGAKRGGEAIRSWHGDARPVVGTDKSDNISPIDDEGAFAFKSKIAKRVFDHLVQEFIGDYARKRQTSGNSGWRSLPQVARELKVSSSAMYGKHGGVAPELGELIWRGLAEARTFAGERGRGGEVTRLRIAYEKDVVRDYVKERVKGAPESEAAHRVLFPRNRVAVLPFANLGPNPHDEYIADGMTEEIITALSKFSGLRVIARTSVSRYKGGIKSVNEIARELGTGTILEGSVRKEGDKIRIAVQLIDSQSSEHLWAESYDRELTNVLEIQSDISRMVAETLKIRILSAEGTTMISKQPAVNSGAYTLYLKGRQLWNERTKESVIKAMKYFELAIRTDPGFAPAYAGLADSHNSLATSLWVAPGRAYQFAWESCNKALQIDNSLAEAHASLGWTLMAHRWDFGAAEREFERAVDLSPNYANAHHSYSLMRFFLQDYKGAYSRGKRALELDPLSPGTNREVATYLATLGKTDEAMERYRQTIDLNPDFASLHFWKSAVHVWLSEYDMGIEEAKKAFDLDGGPLVEQFLAWAYASAGKKDKAKRILNHATRRKVSEYVSPVWTGMVMLALGHDDEGYRWLEKSLADRNQALLYFRGMPWFKEYRSDARWRQIEEKSGLSTAP